MPIEIGYWNLRGLVGFIRLIAEHTGEAVEWVEYDIDNRLGWKYRFCVHIFHILSRTINIIYNQKCYNQLPDWYNTRHKKMNQLRGWSSII